MAVDGRRPPDPGAGKPRADAVDEPVEIGRTGCAAGHVGLRRIDPLGGKRREADHVETETGVDLIFAAGEFFRGRVRR